MTNALVLVVPNPIGDFMVCTDALLEGVSVVLMQDGCVIVYNSRKLKDHELNYPTHDLERVVVMHALFYWRHFLLGPKFELLSDHCSLYYIFNQPNLKA